MERKLLSGGLPSHFDKIEKMQIGIKLHLKDKTTFFANQRLKKKKKAHALPKPL